MKKLDNDGLSLCKYQGNIFEQSVTKFAGSSPIFIRRFCKSDFASKLDRYPITTFSMDENEAFLSLDEQYGKTKYGQIKYDEEILYWLGYMLRYISYTRAVSTIFVYKTIPIKLLINGYSGYHTQSEEQVIASVLNILGLDESYFDPNVRLKKIIELEKQYI